MPKKITISRWRRPWADKDGYVLQITDEYGDPAVYRTFDTLPEAIKFLGEQWPQ